MKKTLGELNGEKGFFSTYYELLPARFAELFGAVTASDLETFDFLLSDMFGGRILTLCYSNLYAESGAAAAMERIVKNCDCVYFQNWCAAKNAVLAALETDSENAGGKVTAIEERKEKAENSTRQDKMNSYDAETPANTDSVENEANYGHSIERTVTETDNKIEDVLNAAKEKIDLAKEFNFFEIVLKTIADSSCVAIY